MDRKLQKVKIEIFVYKIHYKLDSAHNKLIWF